MRTTRRFEAMFGLADMKELPPLEDFALTDEAKADLRRTAGPAHRAGVKARLQKLLAEAGLGSRRGCEDLIRRGASPSTGSREVGGHCGPRVDVVAVDGRTITAQSKEYWLLNKPAGVLSAVVDARGRQTVTDCVPTRARVFPVGRLDLDSTGLLLLTNDGELTERLLHPRFHVDKEYVVKVRGQVDRPLSTGCAGASA